MPAAAQAVGPRYPTSSEWMVRFSSPNSRPCSPACCIAAPRACESPSLLLVTATPASDPGIHHPWAPVSHARRTRCARQRPGAARRARALPAAGNDPRGTPRWPAATFPCPGPWPWHASRRSAEVLGTDRVEELAELLDLVLLLVRDRHTGLVQDLLGGEDGGAGAQRERDRVRGPGAHLLAVGEDEIREEDPVPQRGDVHGRELDTEGFEHVTEKVVRERPRRNHALLGERDRGSLHRADPDRQIPVPLGLLEQDDGLVRGHLDPDADDLHLPHGGSVLAYRQALAS